ncbi:hypothetical protein [Streptomyces sp. CS131]|uniref:hypothetical protein n=1 Tax=Streptomyces sp. CS131 TaxID=2162711 RepID=UPI000D511E4E|nr:hypothetical protein [Streptomyces sp. CS131]PVC82870.1 hypothetical protein DBP20_21050 [Streptomyces sp. CS131]
MTTRSTHRTPPRVLVLGATGKTGRRVVARLRELGVETRAASRSGEVRFDWTLPDTWEPALAGADALYLIAPDDVAAVAAVVLTEDAHAGRTYELSGPRALTFAEATGIIARAAGRPIRYEELTPQAYRAELLAQGWAEADADALGAMFALHRAGHSAEVTDGVRQVLGREAADLEPWARRIAATGVWA